VIFIDTSAWYASSSTGDANHRAAKRVLDSLRERLFTSDYVVSETLTLFRARRESRRAVAFGRKVIDRSFAEIVTVTEQDFAEA